MKKSTKINKLWQTLKSTNYVIKKYKMYYVAKIGEDWEKTAK
jgi:hypothetical protein